MQDASNRIHEGWGAPGLWEQVAQTWHPQEGITEIRVSSNQMQPPMSVHQFYNEVYLQVDLVSYHVAAESSTYLKKIT